MLKQFRLLREHLERKLFHKKDKVDYAGRNRGACRFMCNNSSVPEYFKVIHKNFEGKRVLSNVKDEQKNQHSEKETSKTSSCLDRCYSLVDAVKLSSSFALGYSLCENLRWRKRKYRDDLYEFQPSERRCVIGKILSNNVIWKNIFPKHVLTQPHNVLSNRAIAGTQSINNSLPVYGPMTAEEALNEASQGLKNAHNTAVGELENRLGLRCMSKKRYRKAVIHFSAGAALRSGSAAFNLAQCYELGLGTSQDFTKAAKCYRTASDLGNPTAMYNLAVFYVHGWGGLTSDRKQAQDLMEEAAKLGEPNAKLLVESRMKTTAITVNPTESKENADKANNAKEVKQVIDTLFKSTSDNYQFPYSSFKSDKINADNSGSTGYSSVSRNSVLFSDLEQSASSAAYYSGICYENGIGLKQDLNKAVEHYSIATFKGNSQAMYNLAACYEATAGLNESADSYQIPMLMELYKMAADRGHHYANERLKALEIHVVLGTLKDHLTKSSRAPKVTIT